MKKKGIIIDYTYDYEVVEAGEDPEKRTSCLLSCGWNWRALDFFLVER